MKAVWVGLMLVMAFNGSVGLAQTKEINVRIHSEINSIDWHKTLDLLSARVIFLLIRGLTKITPDGEVQPDLAESWTVSKDLKTYTFKIKKGIKWSDGKDLTAADFEFAFRHVLNPKTAAFAASRFYIFKNAKGYVKGEKVELGVKAIDPYTLKMELERPAAFIPALMSHSISLPGRQDVIEKHGDKWTRPENIQTLGPYKLESWQANRYVLTANPLFYEAKPKIERINFLVIPEDTTAQDMYELGKVDVIYGVSRLSLPKLRQTPEFQIFPHHRITAFAFNIKQPPFDNLKVRQAFSYATDKASIANLLDTGRKPNQKSLYMPMNSWIPVGIKFANPALGFKHNEKKAKELLKEAGYPGGKGLPKITLFFDNREDYKMMAERLQQQWKKALNVNVELVSMDWGTYLGKLRTGMPGIFRIGFGSVVNDPDLFTDVFVGDTTILHTNWRSEFFDDLTYKAAASSDAALRQKLYDQSQRMLLEDDTVIIPIIQEEFPMLISKRVKNLKVNLQSRTFFEKADLL